MCGNYQMFLFLPELLCNVGVVRSQAVTIQHQAGPLRSHPAFVQRMTLYWDWFFVPRSLAFGYFSVVPDLCIDLINLSMIYFILYFSYLVLFLFTR